MLLTESEIDELSRRLADTINEQNRIFEAVGEQPLSGDEVKRLTRELTRAFKRERSPSGWFSETDGARRSSPARSKPPLHETSGEERRRTMAEAADELLPDLPDASAPPATPPMPPHELYRDDQAAWHQWKRESADRLLPDLPGTT
jgi:hypothetical protein